MQTRTILHFLISKIHSIKILLKNRFQSFFLIHLHHSQKLFSRKDSLEIILIAISALFSKPCKKVCLEMNALDFSVDFAKNCA